MGCHSKFARCSAVVVLVFSKIMQELLAKQIPAVNVYNIVLNHTKFKKSLSMTELSTIQTLMTDGFSKLDVALVYKIIKFFNFIPSPTQNWGANPSIYELEIGDDVERIRITSSDLVHRIDCNMEDAEFETFFTKCVRIGIRIDNYLWKTDYIQKEIEFYKTSLIDDPTERKFIAAIKDIENIKEKATLRTDSEMIIKVYYGRSMEELIADVKDEADITSLATSPVKIIINGIDENELKAALLNSIADQLTDDNIQFIKARVGSLILHVRIRTALLKELKVLFEHLTSFLECVLCIAYDDSDVPREFDIVMSNDDDEIESSESDETTEIFLDSNGQSALILDVEVNDRILQSSKILGKVVKEFIGKVITKTHGKEVIREKEVSTILSPRDTDFPNLSQESIHLSAAMNVLAKSLPCIKLNQTAVNNINELWKIICCLVYRLRPIIVGSVAEGLEDLGSDQDVIMVAYQFMVFESRKELDESPFLGIKVLRLRDDKHPGYAKLGVFSLGIFENKGYPLKYKMYIDNKDGNRLLKNTVKDIIFETRPQSLKEYSIHGPAFNAEYYNKKNYQQADPVDIFRIANVGIDSLDMDLVLCIPSEFWLSDALEWTKRKRSSNWLTTNLFQKIINTGYLLAGVGSKTSKDSDTQWRLSLNGAEQVLIESFTETQIHCIILLKKLKKMILSKIAGKNITSYTMKTVMFWCLEEKSVDFWQSSKLICCICFCVSKLKSFVEKGFLPNYFIRERNLFVADEFTLDIQTKTIQRLESFLADPYTSINLLLPSYRIYENRPLPHLNMLIQDTFIKHWLTSRVTMADLYRRTAESGFHQLYVGYGIKNNFDRCSYVLENLTAITYSQPLIILLQNYMGVLNYILLQEEKKTGECTEHSRARDEYSKYIKLSAVEDLPHINLRIATCYLDDGANADCLNMIKKVTDTDDGYFTKKQQHITETLGQLITTFRKTLLNVTEIALYKSIIYEIDLVHQDPYRTIKHFEKVMERGHDLLGYNAMALAWKRCYYDVTFMRAELPVLPKPAALELCIETSQEMVTFNPILYGLLLEFLCNLKNGSTYVERETVVEKMKNCISMLPIEHRLIGLNFIIYCCSLQKDYCSASRYLLQSFKLNPVEQNVAYLYIQYIFNLLRNISFGSDRAKFLSN